VATALKVKPGLIAMLADKPGRQRMRREVRTLPMGFTVVDDSYTPNPRSADWHGEDTAEAKEKTSAAVIVIRRARCLSWGRESPQMHREAGHEIARLGIDVLWGVGRSWASEMLSAAREPGIVGASSSKVLTTRPQPH